MGLKVDTKHREYEANVCIWTKVDAACSGQDALNALDLADPGRFIRKPDPLNESKENEARYKQYVEGSSYVNFVGRTMSGLSGEVFAKEPEIKLTAELEKYEYDIDGAGVTLVQQSRRTLERVMRNGRSGLLTDYSLPLVAEDGTKRETKKKDNDANLIRSTIVAYPASSIYNWNSTRVGSKEILSLLVLLDTAYEQDEEDRFVFHEIDQLKVMELEEGKCVIRIYRKKDKEWQQHGRDVFPMLNKSKHLDFIPFQFVGSVNNDSTCDKGALIDMANVNLAHRQNSADYEEACHMNGQPTVHIDMGDMDTETSKTVNPGGFKFGSRGGYQTVRGKVEYIQTSPNSMPIEGMESKEKQMIALGARIVEPQRQAITATEDSNNEKSQTSVLSTIAKNVSQAYAQALEWMQLFDGGSGEIVFELNSDFEISKLDPQTLLAVIAGYQASLITKRTAIKYTQDVGLEEKTVEEVEQELEENPAGLELTRRENEGGSQNGNA